MVPDKLRQIADEVRNGKTPAESPRTIVSWFGAQRRGWRIVREIRQALTDVELMTLPDFEFEYFDNPVNFVAAKAVPTDAGVVRTEASTPGAAAVDGTIAEQSTRLQVDPTYRIGKLPAANNRPVSVKPDTPVTEVLTLMVLQDFSQIPVMTSDRDVKGMVSWKSLGTRLGVHQECPTAKDCMDSCQEISGDVSLFQAIDLIVNHECVLVRDATQRISGIVTTTDLSLTFNQLGEPFLLLGEIENHVRNLIDGKFAPEELASVKDPSDTERQVTDSSDLTFGEYIRLLQKPEHWQKLRLPLDRKTFVSELERVRDIRNDVMHFDPDGLGPDELGALRKFLRFLHRLHDVGVIDSANSLGSSP